MKREPSGAHQKILAALTGLLLVGGSIEACASPVRAVTASGQSSGETACSQKFARAMTSPGQPVQGVFACQTPSLVFIEMKAGLGTDADLAAYASKAPVFHRATLSGRMADGGILYRLVGDSGSVGRLLVWVDVSGKVTDFIIAKCAVSCAEVTAK